MKKSIIVLFTLILIFVLITGGCSNSTTNLGIALSNETFNTINAEEIRDNIDIDNDNIIGINNLGYNLTKDIYADNDDNILFSPFSLTSAIAMLVNGAEGETKDEIIKAMEADESSLNTTYNQIINLLNSYSEEKNFDDKKVKTTTIKTANSAWFNENAEIKQEYVDNLKKYYDADCMNVDFTDEETKDIINKWIEEKTNNLLKDTIQETKPDDIAYLINTLYFKGTWIDKFNKKNTNKAPFYLSDGNEANVDMMYGEFDKTYYEDEYCQIVGLNYYDATMYVILPKEDLKSFVESENFNNIDEKIDNVSYKTDIEVHFPKFKYNNSINLNDYLKNIGMTKVFEPDGAELKKIADISPYNIYVSKILQNTTIEVDEKGTEAAAVTVVRCEATAMPAPVQEKIVFNCNKPFIYVIKDNRLGINLFMGIVQNPQV